MQWSGGVVGRIFRNAPAHSCGKTRAQDEDSLRLG